MKLHNVALAALMVAMTGALRLEAQESSHEHLDIVYRAGAAAPAADSPTPDTKTPDAKAPNEPATDSKLDDGSVSLDLFTPESGSDRPTPAVVFIHGGGWYAGSKKDLRFAAKDMAKAGYVGVSVGYRLAPKHKFPAQIEDVKCAIRWLRANADKYRIDKERIAVAGASAGGHLALLAGLTLPKDNLEGAGGVGADQSSQVCAVVNFFGPTDLARDGWLPLVDKMIVDFLGGARESIPQTYVAASPMTYIHKGGPPVLTIHGTKDPLVPYSQATLLHEALQKAGESSQLETIEGKGHGDWPPEVWAQVMEKIKTFLGDAFAKQ
jgi:acetyl esterase/lipase